MALARTSLLTRLILRRNQEWLFLEQTPANGGGFTLVGGGVGAQEFAKEALIREAWEEIGIKIKKKNLRLIHTIHRRMPKNAEIIFFFETNIWEGEPISQEIDKFSSVVWLSEPNLPAKMPQVLRFGLTQILKEKDYSQFPKSKDKEKEKEKDKKTKKTKSTASKTPPPSIDALEKSKSKKKAATEKPKPPNLEKKYQQWVENWTTDLEKLDKTTE